MLVLGLSAANGSWEGAGFASSVAPAGPYRWEDGAVAPGAGGDVGVAAGGGGGGDDDDGGGGGGGDDEGGGGSGSGGDGGGGGGGAYLFSGSGANGTAVSRLRPDLLGTTGVCGRAPRLSAPAVSAERARARIAACFAASRHAGGGGLSRHAGGGGVTVALPPPATRARARYQLTHLFHTLIFSLCAPTSSAALQERWPLVPARHPAGAALVRNGAQRDAALFSMMFGAVILCSWRLAGAAVPYSI